VSVSTLLSTIQRTNCRRTSLSYLWSLLSLFAPERASNFFEPHPELFSRLQANDAGLTPHYSDPLRRSEAAKVLRAIYLEGTSPLSEPAVHTEILCAIALGTRLTLRWLLRLGARAWPSWAPYFELSKPNLDERAFSCQPAFRLSLFQRQGRGGG
jgi:hypothetical protein